MASASKSKGAVKTVQWWKHLREWKRVQNKLAAYSQNKLVRRSAKMIIKEIAKEL